MRLVNWHTAPVFVAQFGLWPAGASAMLSPAIGRPGGDVSEASDGVRLSEEQRLDWLCLIRSDKELTISGG